MAVLPTLPMSDYVSDNLGDPRPSLSASMAHTLLARSPRHAWTGHPRLNPGWQRHEDSKFDLGSACHAVMLGDNGTTFEIIDASDWRTKDAKTARDAARAAGRLPLLTHQYEQAVEMADAARAQLAVHEIGNPFVGGQPEVTLTWEVGNVLCKARLDYLPRGRDGDVYFYDLKTTTDTANPDYVDRRLGGTGAFLQAAMHSDGIRANFPGVRPNFRFVMLETEPPYALSVVEPDNAGLEIAHRDVARAIALWDRCTRENRWPGFPSKVCTLDTRSYLLTRAEEQSAREELDREAGFDRLAIGMDWVPGPMASRTDDDA